MGESEREGGRERGREEESEGVVKCIDICLFIVDLSAHGYERRCGDIQGEEPEFNYTIIIL